jgi:phosphatidylglycerol:prolipoprotein diacylglycerol transferase
VRPILFSFSLPVVGDVVFPAYFTLLAIGFAASLWLVTRRARSVGLDETRVFDTTLWMYFWGLVGSRVLHLVADGHFMDYVHLCTNSKLVPAIDARVTSCTAAAQCGYDYLCDLATHSCYPPPDCFAALKLWRGGYAYYGGFLFAVVFSFYYTKKHKMGWLRTADLAAPAIALGLFFGRIGCFLNGCCYGKPTTSRLGVVFPRGGSTWRAQLDAHLIHASQDALPVHPTQLYEAFGCLILFAILYFAVARRVHRRGDVIAGLLVGYGVLRSIIEIFRDDDRGVIIRGAFDWLSTSQIISLPLIGFGVYLLVTRGRRPAEG